MGFGGWNKNYHLENYDKQLIDCSKKSWDVNYEIEIHNFFINNDKIDFNWQKQRDSGIEASIDTGTTFVYFTDDIMKKFTNYMDKYCLQNKDNCYKSNNYQRCYNLVNLKKEDFGSFYKSFPDLKFSFTGKGELIWNPENYFYKKTKEEDLYCIGIKNYGNQILFGAIIMRNYDFFFDLENKKINFFKSDCGKIQLKSQINKELLLKKDDDNKKFVKIKNEKIKSFHSVFGTFFVEGLVIFSVILYGIMYMNKKNEDKKFLKIKTISSFSNSGRIID